MIWKEIGIAVKRSSRKPVEAEVLDGFDHKSEFANLRLLYWSPSLSAY